MTTKLLGRSKRRITMPKGWRKKIYRPINFESREMAHEIRRLLINGLAKVASKSGNGSSALKLSSTCSASKPCMSGLCPVCFRKWRDDFLRFMYEQDWFKKEWIQITVRSDKWRIPAGDHSDFTDFLGVKSLVDIPEIKVLEQRLYRACSNAKKSSQLIIIVSVETTFDKLENEPLGKPFHFHVLVTGLSKAEVTTACKGFEKLPVIKNSGMARPIDIQEVGEEKTFRFLDNRDALSYLIKQPFWRYSKYLRKQELCARGRSKQSSFKKFGSKSPKIYGYRRQLPSAAQLAEIANNLGPIGIRDRFKFRGVEYRNGLFRLPRLKSSKIKQSNERAK